MATIRIYSNNVELPSPVAISTSEEIIWSANTGRSITPSDGALMMGDVIATKKTFNIEWGVLTVQEYNLLVSTLGTGFKPFKISWGVYNGTELVTNLTGSYRGTITGEVLGGFSGQAYFKSASVSIIQR